MGAMIVRDDANGAPFEAAEIDEPGAGDGQVVVRISASSVNTVDGKVRAAGEALPPSPSPPALLGMDSAGAVEEVGPGVTELSIGDGVYGCAGGLADLPGTLTERIAADPRLVARKPERLSLREAAAVQLTKQMGADVDSAGGGDRQLALIESLGATPIRYREESVEDYVARHTGGAGFDVVFDSVGGANRTKSFEAAKPSGHVASTVSMPELDLTSMHVKALSLHVVCMLIPMLHGVGREKHGEVLREVARIVDAGDPTPVLDDRRFTLEDAGAAHARLESGEAMGKIVIDH